MSQKSRQWDVRRSPSLSQQRLLTPIHHPHQPSRLRFRHRYFQFQRPLPFTKSQLILGAPYAPILVESLPRPSLPQLRLFLLLFIPLYLTSRNLIVYRYLIQRMFHQDRVQYYRKMLLMYPWECPKEVWSSWKNLLSLGMIRKVDTP